MAELLIHSMSEFSEIILPALEMAGARTIVEIGAEFGGMSSLLAAYVAERDGHLVSVDPAPKPEFLAQLAESSHRSHVPLPSLEAFGGLNDVDAWVVDGDHNWYTVYNELKGIDRVSRRDGKPLLVFLHDVAWPCGRRDFYYAPDRIPEPFLLPYSFEAGTVPGDPGVRIGRGFRGEGQFAIALHEGGPCNGVLTAIEDFMADQLNDGRELGFAEVPAVFGLGVLFDLDAEWSGPLAELLMPYHQNKLIDSLEQNRLANYLRVIEMQDMNATTA